MSDGPLSDRELLKRFGLISDQDFARLLGIGVKSLQNRPREKLPEYVKAGRRRLYVEKSVREFLGLPPGDPSLTASSRPPPATTRGPDCPLLSVRWQRVIEAVLESLRKPT